MDTEKNMKKLSVSITDHSAVKEAVNLLDVWLDALRDYKEIPGFSVGLVLDQDLFWSKGFGYSNPDKKIPATPETIYSICSISKLFTSISVMMLRDQGKLKLDDPVGKHLDWFKIEQTGEDSKGIDIKGILTHSSGLPREAGEFYWNGPNFVFPDKDEMIAHIKKQKTLYPAATYSQYSNLGMALAGEIVAACSGQTYAEYIADHILKPLGMSNTSPYFPLDLHGNNMATGYSFKNRQGKRQRLPAFDTAAVTPAAGLASTVIDLSKFVSWQFRLLEKGGHEILNANTLREMHRVHWVDPDWKTIFGLGFKIEKDKENVLVGHRGLCPGYSSFVLMNPISRLAVIVMTNESGGENLELLENIFKIIDPALKKAGQPAPKPGIDFIKYEGSYDVQPWGGEMAVIPWQGQLATVALPARNPMAALTKYRHVTGNTFRRVREEDNTLAEPLEFQLNEANIVTSMIQHNSRFKKIIN